MSASYLKRKFIGGANHRCSWTPMLQYDVAHVTVWPDPKDPTQMARKPTSIFNVGHVREWLVDEVARNGCALI